MRTCAGAGKVSPAVGGWRLAVSGQPPAARGRRREADRVSGQRHLRKRRRRFEVALREPHFLLQPVAELDDVGQVRLFGPRDEPVRLMAVDVHVEHLHQLPGRQFARDHVAIGDRDPEAVDRRADRVVEQVEFVAAARVDVGDAGGLQPVLPGQVALVVGGEHVQQREAVQVDRRAVLSQPRIQRGCADGDMLLLHQQCVVEAVPFAVAEADCAVEHARFAETVVNAGREAQLEFGMRVAQPAEPRHQPARGEGGRHVRAQAVQVGFFLQAAYGQLDLVERLLQCAQQHAAGRRQFELVMTPLEQGFAELALELANLAAHRALRYVEQFGRAREAAGAAGHLEGFQRVQRRHLASHGAVSCLVRDAYCRRAARARGR
ncbi:hypothetical protein BCEP4_130026 [Burkholderia cepacia]|nr:hypothetical protein BCEP4_130026 [Burkholderia cepacia]